MPAWTASRWRSSWPAARLRVLGPEQILERLDWSHALLTDLDMTDPVVEEAAEQADIAAKYSGYIKKQESEVARVRRLEERSIPDDFPFEELAALKVEARQKLARFRPATVGQASRIAGVTPADVAVLLVHLKRMGA